VSSEDLNILQRDARAAIQQLRTQSPAAAALQMQLVQAAQLQAASNGVGVVDTPSTAPGEQYLVFSLENYELAVKAEQVQGVERLVDLTPLPNVMPWVRGVVNLRGAIASVIDLRMFLELEQLAYTPRTRLLSLLYNEMVICFVVDGVSEMLPIPPTAIIGGPTRQATIPHWAVPYAAGCANIANRLIVLLDVAHLLFSEKMQRYEAF
jgi:purine-binding chemotaxis protein CheW